MALTIIMIVRPANATSFGRPRAGATTRPMTPSMSNVVPQPISWVTASTVTVCAERKREDFGIGAERPEMGSSKDITVSTSRRKRRSAFRRAICAFPRSGEKME